jgi:hypothetical protein
MVYTGACTTGSYGRKASEAIWRIMQDKPLGVRILYNNSHPGLADIINNLHPIILSPNPTRPQPLS